MRSRIKEIIKQYQLKNFQHLIYFIQQDPLKLQLNSMQKLIELVNTKQQQTKAYYTDNILVQRILKYLPIIHKQHISVLEPAVGIGNLLIPFLQKMIKHYQQIDVYVNDIDKKSLTLFKLLIHKYTNFTQHNLKFYYYNKNFLKLHFHTPFDYIISNPPFQRITKRKSNQLGFTETNLAGCFLDKSLQLGKIVSLVMPKIFLESNSYNTLRKQLTHQKISNINDFGETGFKGVSVETISLTVEPKLKPTKTIITSIPRQTKRVIKQSYYTDNYFPNWLIYRNHFFDKIAQYMRFNIFKACRGHQVTNSNTNHQKGIRVIKSRNLSRDGKRIINIKGYDTYINPKEAKQLKDYKYYKNKSVYLTPNMTYYPRIFKKTHNFLINGSVAMLIPKHHEKLSQAQMNFINSSTFTKFYNIARNHSSRSLNINNKSAFWFGKYTKNKK